MEREEYLRHTDLGDFYEAAQQWALEISGSIDETGQRACFRDDENIGAWEGLKQAIVDGDVPKTADALVDLLMIIVYDFKYVRDLPAVPDLNPPGTSGE